MSKETDKSKLAETYANVNTGIGIVAIALGFIISSAVAVGYGAFNVAQGEGVRLWSRKRRKKKRQK